MARKLSATPDHNPKAEVGDNSAAVEEANRIQLISIVSRLTDADDGIEAAMVAVKAARAVRKQIIGLGKAAGYPAWELMRRQEEMTRTTAENADQVRREAQQRRWLGIITPEQASMFNEGTTPEEVRDASHWKAEGYKAGLLNKAAVLPDGAPSRHVQDFLQGHEDGRKSYLLTLAKDAPKPKGTKAEQIAADANAILEQDALDEAAKKLAKSDFMKTGAPDAEGFEMTEEEREAQKLRPSVQETEEAVL